MSVEVALSLFCRALRQDSQATARIGVMRALSSPAAVPDHALPVYDPFASLLLGNDRDKRNLALCADSGRVGAINMIALWSAVAFRAAISRFAAGTHLFGRSLLATRGY